MLMLLQTLVTPATQSSSSGVATGAVSAGKDVVTMVQNVNWANPTWDLFIVLFFIVTVFLYGMTLGRDRVIVILVSIYMAMAVVANAPILATADGNVTLGEQYVVRVSTFLGCFLLLFFMMSRSVLLKAFGNSSSGSWWQVMLFSIFHVGLLVSVTLSFLPADAVNNLAPITRQVFASENGKFFWVVVPVLSMVFIKAEEPGYGGRWGRY